MGKGRPGKKGPVAAKQRDKGHSDEEQLSHSCRTAGEFEARYFRAPLYCAKVKEVKSLKKCEMGSTFSLLLRGRRFGTSIFP